MKLINNSPRNYIACKIILEAGKVAEITDKKAIELFLKQDGVSEYIDKQEVEQLKKEIKQLKQLNKKTKEK